MRKLTAVFASALFALAMSPVNLLALPEAPQVQGLGNIAGTAVSTTAQPISTAGVSLIGPNGAVISTGVTNAAGGFTFAGVQAGTYTVQITAVVNGTVTVVGTASVTVAAGATASLVVSTSVISAAVSGAAAAAAAASSAGAAGTTVATTTATVLTTAGAAAVTAVTVAVVETSSPSR
jgi:hypothetical protein